jgi:hypothetical protein
MVGAIIYPNFGGVAGRCRAENLPLSASSVRKLIESELNKYGAEMVPFKRVSEIVLTSIPLPKTLSLSVARGHVKDSYSFDVKRWQRAAEAGLGTSSEPSRQAEEKSESA